MPKRKSPNRILGAATSHKGEVSHISSSTTTGT